MDIEVSGPKKMLTWLSAEGEEIFSISESVVTGWVVVLILSIVCYILGRNLEMVPKTKRQCAAEFLVKTVNGLIENNMNKDCVKAYAPFIAALFSYILLGSLISLTGLRSVTADISVTGALAALVFVLITYTKLKYQGLKNYLLSFVNPLNLISEVANPVAMALRLFGNVSAGMIIGIILYAALGSASGAIYGLLGFNADVYYFNIFQVGIPAVLSIYFDLFSGVIQSYVFIMLTMAYIYMGRE